MTCPNCDADLQWSDKGWYCFNCHDLLKTLNIVLLDFDRGDNMEQENMKLLRIEFDKKLAEAKEMTNVQGDNGNWNYDPYMHGMFNGMEYVLAIFDEREPKFREAPKEWLSDKTIEKVEAVSSTN